MDDLIYQLAYEAIPLVTGHAMVGREAEPLIRALAITAKAQAGQMTRMPGTMQFAPPTTSLLPTITRPGAVARPMGPIDPGMLLPPGEEPWLGEGAPLVGDPFMVEQRTFNGVTYSAYSNPEQVVSNMGDFPVVEIDDPQFPYSSVMLMEAGSGNPFSVWVNNVFMSGFGVVTIETDEGGVYAPTTVIEDVVDLQAAFGPARVVVLADPVEGWKHRAAEPEKPNYLLYGGIAVGAVVLLGAAYYMTR
jgi:hypothetical protein